jgi:hypothetical protein
VRQRVIAGFQFNGQYLSDAGVVDLLVGSADDRFEFVGMVWGRRTRLPRAGFVGPGEDLERISLEAAEQPFTAEGAITFWRDCERFAGSVAQAIDAIMEKLISRGHLDGGEVARLAAAAMTADRPHGFRREPQKSDPTRYWYRCRPIVYLGLPGLLPPRRARISAG